MNQRIVILARHGKLRVLYNNILKHLNDLAIFGLLACCAQTNYQTMEADISLYVAKSLGVQALLIFAGKA